MAIGIRRLRQSDEVGGFDCGDAPLNNYLARHAWPNQSKSSIGVTYIAVDDEAPAAPLGYFTLAMSSLPREEFPAKYVRGLPAYPLPLILLARLAVDRRFTGHGLGQALLGEALRIALSCASAVGCRGIITDAYSERVAWYARYGFVPLEGAPEGSTVKMFLDIRTLRTATEKTK